MKCCVNLIGVNLFGLSVYIYDKTNKRFDLEIDWKDKTIYSWRK